MDDTPPVRAELARALREAGLEVLEAGDGAEAWRVLQRGRVDLLVTDMNMPVMDGLKLIALVRGEGAHRTTPIVVVTAEAADEDRRRAEGLGADAYLVKPVQGQQVVEVARRLLGLR